MNPLLEIHRDKDTRFIIALQESLIALAPFFILLSFLTLVFRLPAYFGLDLWGESSALETVLRTSRFFSSVLLVVSVAYHFALRYDVDRPVSIFLALLSFFSVQSLLAGEQVGTLPPLPVNIEFRQIAIPIASVFVLQALSPYLNLPLEDWKCSIYPCRIFQYIITFFVAYLLLIFAGVLVHQAWEVLAERGRAIISFSLPSIILLEWRALVVQTFWFFGIHGQRIANTIMDTSFLAEEVFPNLLYRQFYRLFAVSGGSGMGLAILIALYIKGRDVYSQKIVRVSTPFALFNINTLLIYALPIVLNRFLLIPFILVPLLNLAIAYLTLSVWPVTFYVSEVDWMMPPFVDAWIVSNGNVRLLLLQGALLSLSVLIYLPFVKRFSAIRSINYHLENLNHNLEITESLQIFRDLKLHKAQHEVIEANSRLDQIIKSLSRETLLVYYQPQVEIHHRRCDKFEALLRVQLSDGRIVSPFFLDDLESAGLSPAIDLWVCQEVKSHLQSWALKNYTPQIAINLHPDTTNNREIIEQIITVLDGMDIEFEIVERSLLDGEHVSKNLEKLRQHGFSIAIDDFGKGYFSYYTLANIHADVIKIDQSLIELLQRQKGLAIWQHMINLCHDLQIQTIAEGVETPEQLTLLSKMGIDLVQGFYFSEAIPVSQVHHYYQSGPCKDN